MKLALITAALLAVGAARAPRSLTSHYGANRPHVDSAESGLDMCPLCIQFTGEAIQTLLNLILNGGVVGTCGTLCQALEQKTGSQALGAVCDLLCDVVGIEEFIKLIQKADLDPIYFCELLKTCPINDNGDATITGLTIDPVTGPQGTRSISFSIQSKNGTGTGELVLEVRTVDGIPVGDSFLMKAANASAFPVPQNLNLKAEPNPDCDPTQQMCEMWLPGNYTLIVAVCNGECGSQHPHSQIYDRKQTNFTITG